MFDYGALLTQWRSGRRCSKLLPEPDTDYECKLQQPYFGNCESVMDHGPDRGSQFADRRPLRQSGPVQNQSGPAGLRFLDQTTATLFATFRQLRGSYALIHRGFMFCNIRGAQSCHLFYNNFLLNRFLLPN